MSGEESFIKAGRREAGQERGVFTFDGPLGFPPDTVVAYDAADPGWGEFPPPGWAWTPFRDRISLACYRLPSGAMVHVRPECRCPR